MRGESPMALGLTMASASPLSQKKSLPFNPKTLKSNLKKPAVTKLEEEQKQRQRVRKVHWLDVHGRDLADVHVIHSR